MFDHENSHGRASIPLLGHFHNQARGAQVLCALYGRLFGRRQIVRENLANTACSLPGGDHALQQQLAVAVYPGRMAAPGVAGADTFPRPRRTRRLARIRLLAAATEPFRSSRSMCTQLRLLPILFPQGLDNWAQSCFQEGRVIGNRV